MSNTPVPISGRNSGVNWTVSGASQGLGQDATGRYVQGWEVTYTLDTGHTGTVFVPGSVANQDAIKAAINQSANALNSVINMSSSS